MRHAQRTVLELRAVQGMTSTEVCELLDVSEVNQRVLLSPPQQGGRRARAVPRGRGCVMRQPLVRVEFVETVTEWMEGALPDDDRAQLEEHLSICRHYTEYLVQLRLVTAVVHERPTEAPPSAARDALLAAFRRERGS